MHRLDLNIYTHRQWGIAGLQMLAELDLLCLWSALLKNQKNY